MAKKRVPKSSNTKPRSKRGSFPRGRRSRSRIPAKVLLNLEDLRSGHERTLAQGLTWVQNSPETAQDLLQQVYPLATAARGRGARIFGLTGPPGAGKSTLLGRLLQQIATTPTGVVLVDPSSPFSGGALLGDRIRFEADIAPGHFVRSVGTRGAGGGLNRATADFVRLYLAAGKEVVWIETVGVGQTEVEIMDLADVTIVVLTPDSGDTIQTMKAGLLEIADLFVVNKADLPGADRMVADLESLREGVEVFPVVATTGEGVAALWDAARSKAVRTPSSRGARGDLANHLVSEVARRVGEVARERAQAYLQSKAAAALRKDLESGRTNPYRETNRLLRKLL